MIVYHRNRFHYIILGLVVPHSVGTWRTLSAEEVVRLPTDAWCRVRGDPYSAPTFGDGQFLSLLCAMWGKYLGGWKRIVFFDVATAAAHGEAVFLHFRDPDKSAYVRVCVEPLITPKGAFGVLLGRNDVEFLACTAANVPVSLEVTESIARRDALRYPSAPLY